MLLQFFFVLYDALLSLVKYIFQLYNQVSQDWSYPRKL